MERSVYFFACLAVWLLVHSAHAAIPHQIHYQGRVVVDGVNYDGTGSFKFLLYQHFDSPEVTDQPLWSNATTSPSNMDEPATAVDLNLSSGLYSVGLGDPAIANMATLPSDLVPVIPYDTVYLRVWFKQGSSFVQLTPDQPVRSVPYALHAVQAESAAEGSITSLALAPEAVTAEKLQPGAVSQLGNPTGSIPDALKIDEIGHAGIGTTEPAAALHVAGGLNVTNPKVLSSIAIGQYTKVVNNGNTVLAVANSYSGEIVFHDISDVTDPSIGTSLFQGQTTNGHLYDKIPTPNAIAFDPSGTLMAIVSDDEPAGSGDYQWITLVALEDANTVSFVGFIEDDVDGFDDLDNIYDIAISTIENRRILAAASYDFLVNDPGTVSLIDISEPSSPQLLSVIRGEGEFEQISSPYRMDFEGDVLVVTSYNDNSIGIFDCSQPEAPVLRAVLAHEMETDGHTYMHLAEVQDVDLHGNILAIASEDAGGSILEAVTLVEISDLSSPQHLRTIAYSPTETPFIKGTIRVAMGGDNQLAIGGSRSDDLFGASVALYDISSPGSPALSFVLREGQGEFGGLAEPNPSFAGDVLLINGYRDGVVSLVDTAVSTPAAAGFIVNKRVGVGVVDPSAALHVAGDVRIDHASRFDVQSMSASIGALNAVSGNFDYALGYNNLADARAFAMGVNNVSTDGSFVLGYNSIADRGGMAFGANNEARNNGLAVGTLSKAMGYNSMAFGYSANASGERAVAIADGSASGETSLSIGDGSIASGNRASALGGYAQAIGDWSSAIGFYAEALGDNSVALGKTIASSYAEISLGQYNTTPQTVHSDISWDDRDRLLVIGNGSDGGNRSDVMTIFKDGRMLYEGDIFVIGDVHTIANYRYNLPRYREYQIPTSAFQPADYQTDFLHDDGFIKFHIPGSSTSGVFKAPVHLPDGSTITELSVHYYDGIANEGPLGPRILSIQGTVRRMGNGEQDLTSESVVATLSAGTSSFEGGAGKNSVTSLSVDLPTVDHSYQYWIEVDFNVDRASDHLRFYGATITYTQEVVAP